VRAKVVHAKTLLAPDEMPPLPVQDQMFPPEPVSAREAFNRAARSPYAPKPRRPLKDPLRFGGVGPPSPHLPSIDWNKT
jgi:hypothetical protein